MMVKQSFEKQVIGAVLLLISGLLSAHPGWGLEVSDAGDVYFTDLVHVYRIDAQGQTHIHVADVHSHDLQFSHDGYLYGTHEWYDPTSGQFRRNYWKVNAEGVKTDVEALEAVRWLGVPLEGLYVMPHSNIHLKYTSFLHESKGQATQELYHQPMGTQEGDIKQSRWGVFADWKTTTQFTYFTTGGQVKSLDSDHRVKTVIGVAHGYDYSDQSFSRLLGIDVDRNQHIYLADHQDRSFLKFDGQHIEVIAESGWSWAATGVKYHADQIYLLEYNRWPWSGAVRVRMLNSQGQIIKLGENKP